MEKYKFLQASDVEAFHMLQTKITKNHTRVVTNSTESNPSETNSYSELENLNEFKQKVHELEKNLKNKKNHKYELEKTNLQLEQTEQQLQSQLNEISQQMTKRSTAEVQTKLCAAISGTLWDENAPSDVLKGTIVRKHVVPFNLRRSKSLEFLNTNQLWDMISSSND